MALFEKKDDYIELLKNQIRCKKAKNLVADEISNHIDDQKDSYILDGYDENTALIKSLEQMGDPVEVGKQMDKIHKPSMEWYTLLLVMALCTLGIAAQISLTGSIDISKLTMNFDVGRHIFFIAAGLVLMMITYFLDYSFIGKYPKVIWIFLLAVIIFYGPIGVKVNGSVLYLYAYGMLFIPVYGGIIYAYRNKGYTGIIKCLLFCMTVSMIERQYVAQASVYLGLVLSCLIMLSAAAMKNWFGLSKIKGMAMVWGWITFAGFVLLLGSIDYIGEYQIARLRSKIDIVLNPELYEKGYQMNAVRKIITQAGLFGGAPDFSIGYLPGLRNDYILTYVIGKWGVVPGLLIIIIFMVFISRMIYLSLKFKNSLGMFIGLGCSLVFAEQGVIYILSNLSIQLFITQVNLPFVSYGGSGLLINFIVLGILLSVFRNRNIIKEIPYKEKIILNIERIK